MSLRRCFLWARASSALMNSVPGEKFVPPLVHCVSRSPALYSYFAQHFSFLFSLSVCKDAMRKIDWTAALLLYYTQSSFPSFPVHFFFRCWGIPHYRACIFLLFPFIFEQQQTHYYLRVDRAGLDIRLLRNWRNKLDGPYTLDLFSSPSFLVFTNLNAPWLVGWLVQRCSLPVGLGFTLSMSVWISDTWIRYELMKLRSCLPKLFIAAHSSCT
jgi:hypothetical protein